MAKKWNEVANSPEFQALSAQDKAAAQAQYFDEVVKPQLAPEDVEEAHNQFYQQNPISAPTTAPEASAPQQPTDTRTEEEKADLFNPDNWTLENAKKAFVGEGGLLPTLGAGIEKALLTDHFTDKKEAIPTGASAGWYKEQMANPQTAANAGYVAKELPKQAAYIAASLATGGLAAPIMEAAGVSSPFLAGLGTSVSSNLAGSLASQGVGGEGFSLEQTGEDVLAGEVARGLGGLAKMGVRTARNYLPESLGGKSMVEHAAEAVRPEFTAAVHQGGDEAGQRAFTTATTNEAGESILNPSQTMNPASRFGKAAIGEEQRTNRAMGTASPYVQNAVEQGGGESYARAITEADTGANVQGAASDITSAVTAQNDANYNNAIGGVKTIFDENNIKGMKLNDTVETAQKHLESHQTGGVNLSKATRDVLRKVKNTSIVNDANSHAIDKLDSLKRSLNQVRSAEYAEKKPNEANIKALTETVNSLRNEADSIISTIDPEAGSLYQDSDKYFSQTIGIGEKSQLGKLSGIDNEVKANTYFLGANSLQGRAEGVLNTNRTLAAIDAAVRNGDLQEGERLAAQLRESIGNASRNQSFDYANTGQQFNLDTLANRLKQYAPQAEAAGQTNVNEGLRSALGVMGASEEVGAGVPEVLGDIAGRTAGGIIGSHGGPGGAYAGQKIGSRIASIVPNLLDRAFGTAAKSKEMINWTHQPENAKAVIDLIAARGENWQDAAPETIAKAIDFLSSGGKYAAIGAISGSNSRENSDRATQKAQVDALMQNPANEPQPQPEPVQKAQSVQAPRSKFPQSITNLYKSFASAETGNLADRFIRTRAPEGKLPSTAYGPAQITLGLASDYYQHHPQLFTAKELDYLRRFQEQGRRFYEADRNDPVYGYGKSGTLNSKADKALYADVARKILAHKMKKFGGDINAVVKSWRGKDDPAYAGKIKAALKYYG